MSRASNYFHLTFVAHSSKEFTINMKKTVLIVAALLQTAFLLAQHEPQAPNDQANAKTILEAFKKGHYSGSFRSFFMATDNTRQLSDYYALAAGGNLNFNSAAWHGFSFGIGGMFNYNLASSDLSAIDSITGAKNRYEIGLFDVENPKNRKDLDRMEEFWLRYSWKNTRMTLGQQSLQTPFVNYQDGRMRPTVESGIWVSSEALNNMKIEGGWLWRISPRSTVRWYDIGESIGLYPKGLNPDGTGSGYPENLKSAGIGLVGITRHFGQNTKVQVWNQYVDNIFNTAFVQADYTHPLKNGHKLLLGLQVTHQDALADGGNSDAAKTYFKKGGKSNAISLQTGWQRGGWQALGAYTRVSADGRFLAPREWGREPFFTFMPRERVEGSGDSHSITGRVRWASPNKKLGIEAAYGRFYLPDVRNNALNKYAFPAFNQFNIDLRYTFSGALGGLRAQLLFVRKNRIGDVYGNDKFVINKADVSHFNIILNYTY